jgi:hypothetical protein
LTPYQVSEVYFHKRRSDTGELVLPKDESNVESMEDLFFMIWRRRGLPESSIKRKWEEENGGR